MKRAATVIVAIATLAGVHAAHARAAELRAEAELTRMTALLAPLSEGSAGPRRVSLNGGLVAFDTATVGRPIAEVMADVERECRSGRASLALARPALGEGPDDISLTHVESQSAQDGAVRASLCSFASGGDMPRVRYTLAHRVDGGSTRVFTIVNESTRPLEAMFPAEGDAPGSDLRGVARPEESRRTLTAIVNDGEHEVRTYETSLPLGETITRYDRSMVSLGWATTASEPEGRMYRKESARAWSSHSSPRPRVRR